MILYGYVVIRPELCVTAGLYEGRTDEEIDREIYNIDWIFVLGCSAVGAVAGGVISFLAAIATP